MTGPELPWQAARCQIPGGTDNYSWRRLLRLLAMVTGVLRAELTNTMSARLRWVAASAGVGSGVTALLGFIVVPMTVERSILISCNNSPIAPHGPYNPAEMIRLGWFAECTYATDWAFTRVAGEIAVGLLITCVLAALARDWSNGRPPSWAIELVAFAGGAVVAIAGMAAAYGLGVSFAYSNRTAHYPGYIVGAAYIGAACLFFVAINLGVKVGGAIGRRANFRSGAGTGVLVIGSTAIAIVVATVIVVIAAAIAIYAMAIYAAIIVFWFIVGAAVLGTAASALSDD